MGTAKFRSTVVDFPNLRGSYTLAHVLSSFSQSLYLSVIMAAMFLFLYCTSMIHLLSAAADHEFVYNGFNSSDLFLDGAVITNGAGAGILKLTNKSRHVIGRAFYRDPIPVRTASSWSTHFVFQISPAGPDHRGGYGFAFTLSPSRGFPDGQDGQWLGVLNPDNDGRASNRIFMVDFDTVNGFNHTEDTEGNHVGININTMESNASKSAAYHVSDQKDEDIFLETAGPIQAWIEYDGVIGKVNVTISPRNVPKPRLPLMSFPINLSNFLADQAYAGFSAATGENKASAHYILGWSFRLNGEASPLNLSKLPDVPTEEMESSNSRRIRTALIITFSILVFAMTLAVVTLLCYRRVTRFSRLEDWELECPHRFRYKDLYRATKGFGETEKIGVGGFGAVYKGILSSSSTAASPEVAVKKIMSNNPLQGMREFAAEIESLGRLRHKNLVNLQGWCKHKNDLLLVYDYVPNGSLHSLLYKSKPGMAALTWNQRFNILKGVASGLLYLHEEWEQVVIHRDVKSSNVLIDCSMNARLGDFGLARLYDHGKCSHTTNVVGTIGYIAPELTRTGKASTSTDVFAYGILLLEVACGRAPVVYEMDQNVILVDWLMECMQMGNLFDAVDVKLNSVYSREEMELVLGLGLVCSHPKADARPSMRQVMKYLNGDEMFPLLDGLRVVDDGSRRAHEITSRFLELTMSTDSSSYQLYSFGTMSSFESGR